MKATTSSSLLLCPIHTLAEILSDRWTILIIRDLLTSKKRFCELEKSLQGISTRTLTLKLQILTKKEMVVHSDHYYSVTKKGKKLRPIIKAMETVGKTLYSN